MLGQRAGSTVSIYSMCVYNAESPKQDSRRFNSIVKTKYIDDLGIVYLWLNPTDERRNHCTHFYTVPFNLPRLFKIVLHRTYMYSILAHYSTIKKEKKCCIDSEILHEIARETIRKSKKFVKHLGIPAILNFLANRVPLCPSPPFKGKKVRINQ